VEKKSCDKLCIACSIFKNEIKKMNDRGELDFDIKYMSSMLHMYPSKLQKKLSEKVAKDAGSYEKITLLYGDCHPFMHEMDELTNVKRTQGINCVEILLGKERFRKLRKEGVFFFMPEWTIRWEEVFRNELGLNPELAKEFMQEMHSKLVYLDTGQIPIPDDILKKISEYTGLNYEIIKVELEMMRTEIEKTFDRMKK